MKKQRKLGGREEDTEEAWGGLNCPLKVGEGESANVK